MSTCVVIAKLSRTLIIFDTALFSIYNVMLDFTGGALSVGQLVMDCEISHDWSQLSGDPVKFFLGNISMFFDVIFFVQASQTNAREKQCIAF